MNNKMKELPYDFDITVNNMIPFNKEEEVKGFKIIEAEFGDPTSKKMKTIKMNVLSNGIPVGSMGARQIFKMKDRYVLEVEDEDVEYFYSENINDLVEEI